MKTNLTKNNMLDDIDSLLLNSEGYAIALKEKYGEDIMYKYVNDFNKQIYQKYRRLLSARMDGKEIE
jgi:hypothetical protein